MFRKSFALVAAAALSGLLANSTRATCCPFCGAVQSTLSQDIKNSDVSVIAKLVALPVRAPTKEGELDISTPMATLEVIEVLKGKEALGGATKIQAPFFDDKPLGGEYLVQAAQPPALIWSTPLALTPRSRAYLAELIKLPESSSERLVYLMGFLGDSEELLARDSYDEFALAPYAALKAIKDQMPHDKLVKRIEDLETTPSSRRLYLTMLGVCGGPQDVAVLEKLLRSKEPKLKAGLDATVACYLVLRGEAGLTVIQDLFLKKDTDEFTDIFSVVMALRVLGQEKGVIPQEKIVETMRMVLDHPRVADQAIMDLARWQDWTVIDRLVDLYKSKDPDVVSFVRVPVINYLRACPLPKAREYIEELRKIDPKSVQQSETLYAIDAPLRDPTGQGPAPAPRATATQAGLIGDNGGQAKQPAPELKVAFGDGAPSQNSSVTTVPATNSSAAKKSSEEDSQPAQKASPADDATRRTWGLAGGVLLIVVGLGAMMISAARKGRKTVPTVGP